MQKPNTATISIRLSIQNRAQLEEMADATGRSKSYLAAQAIQQYLETQAWQIKAIQNAVDHADSSNAKFVDHKEVSKWLDTWDGTEK